MCWVSNRLEEMKSMVAEEDIKVLRRDGLKEPKRIVLTDEVFFSHNVRQIGRYIWLSTEGNNKGELH